VKNTSIPQPLVIVLIVVGFLVAGLGGYFVVLGPQRSHAASLEKQIADTQGSIDSARALTLQAKQGAKIRVADIFRLTKAMPDQTDMAGILLELNQVAQNSGITFSQITPATVAVALSGYEAIPITVEFEGNFYELSDLLYRLRNLVDVRHGALDSGGRLFAIDSIDFSEDNPPGFPQIKAHLTIDAFVYGVGTAPTVEPAGAASTGTTGATGATGATGTTGASGATGTTGASGTPSTAASAAPAGG
jgi:Tfp pilus assembly protein PilO